MSTVPFVCRSKAGESLFAGLTKVLAAAKAPVTLAKTDAKSVAASSTHVLAEPLTFEDSCELANKFELTTKLSEAKATAWYPNSIYSNMTTVAVSNLYSTMNPSYKGGPASSSTALATPPSKADTAALAVLDLQKDAEKAFTAFFNAEAAKSLTATLKLACEKAIESKSDKKTVVVVSKPMGEATSPFDDMLAGLVKSEVDSRADELRAANVGFESQASGVAWPKFVLSPEATDVLLCPPTETGSEMESLFVGMGGGNGMVSQTLMGGAKVYTSAGAENPTGALLAACSMLESMGFVKEAGVIAKALEKTYTTDKILPADLPGGKADLDTFIAAVAKNC